MNALDRDAAREVLASLPLRWRYVGDEDRLLDALEGCVRPEPQQTIDRDLLVQGLGRAMHPGMGEHPTPEWLADWILALLQPSDGVLLTRKDAARLMDAVVRGGFRTDDAADQVLAERLEAAS